MFASTLLLTALAASAHASLLPLTGFRVQSDGPLPPTPYSAVPAGRPVTVLTPQILEHRRTQKTVQSKYNVAVPQPIVRKKVVQDVHHKHVAQPYAVPRPYTVVQPVPVPQPYNVYHHELELQDPLHVVRHHQHTQRVHTFPLVKTADVVHVSHSG